MSTSAIEVNSPNQRFSTFIQHVLPLCAPQVISKAASTVLLLILGIAAFCVLSNPADNLPSMPPHKPDNPGNKLYGIAPAADSDNYQTTNDLPDSIAEGLEKWEQKRIDKRDAEHRRAVRRNHNEELAKWDDLESEYKKLKNYISQIDDVYKAMLLESYTSTIADVDNYYKRAQETKIQIKKGWVHTYDHHISDALRKTRDCYINITQKIDQYTKNKEIRSLEEMRKENAKLLAFTLSRSAFGYEYIVDSYGFTRDYQGRNSILTINGYWRYDVSRVSTHIDKFLKDIGFSEQKNSDSNFMIFVLTDDNYNGKKYYGKQSDFDMRDLHKQCGLYNYYGSISGYYTYIKLSSYTSIPILCQRINNDVNLDNLYTITMDLRPKAWTKWTYTRFQLSDHEMKAIYNEAKVEISFKKNSHTPYTIQHTSRNELYADHAKFNTTVRSGIAKSVSGIDDNLSSQEFASIIKIYCKNLSADECFAHARNVEANIDRIRKSAGGASDASRDIDIERQYEKAYMFYCEATDKGHEIAQANCAILLANLRFKSYGIWGHNVNYILAAFFFEDLVKKSKNPKVLKVSYSWLSALYQRGGYGLDKDPQKAQKYLQLSRKY